MRFEMLSLCCSYSHSQKDMNVSQDVWKADFFIEKPALTVFVIKMVQAPNTHPIITTANGNGQQNSQYVRYYR